MPGTPFAEDAKIGPKWVGWGGRQGHTVTKREGRVARAHINVSNYQHQFEATALVVISEFFQEWSLLLSRATLGEQGRPFLLSTP